ncbi:MAG: hypothetical protein AAFX05_12330 [Planctomycetota bacterium]
MGLSRQIVLILVIVVLAALIGCGGSQNAASAERQQRIGPGRVTPEQIQSEVMAFTDNYLALVQPVLDRFIRKSETPADRRLYHSIKVEVVQSSTSIASSANPLVAMLDMTVMVALQRRTAETFAGDDPMMRDVNDELIRVLTTLEQSMWELTGRALNPPEQEGLRQIIDAIWEEFGGGGFRISWIRASEFAGARQSSVVSVQGGGNLFQLFYLDPLAGLSPAAKEIAQSRLLGERVFFFAKRLPEIVNLQLEEVLLSTAELPEFQSTIEAADRASRAADQASQQLSELPQIIDEQRTAAIEQASEKLTVEREAAIDQMFEGVAAEREAIITRLEQNEQQMSALLREARQTVEASTALSESATVTAQAATALANAITEMKGPPRPDKRPFDITEYQATVESATRTVEELNALTSSIESILDSPGWEERGAQIGEVAEHGNALVDRIFWRSIVVVVVALSGLGVLIFLRAKMGRPA